MPIPSLFKRNISLVLAAFATTFCLNVQAEISSPDKCSLKQFPLELQKMILKLSVKQQKEIVDQCRSIRNTVNAELMDPESDVSKGNYYNELDQKITQSWRQHPEFSQVKIGVLFELTPLGTLSQATIHQSSGDTLIDAKVLDFLKHLSFSTFAGKNSVNRRILLTSREGMAWVQPLLNLDNYATTPGDLINVQSSIERYLQDFPLSYSKNFLDGLIVTIDVTGKVKNIAMQHSSGSQALDELAKQVVLKAGPYSPSISQKQQTIDIYVLLAGYLSPSGDSGEPESRQVRVDTATIGREESNSFGNQTNETNWMEKFFSVYWGQGLTQFPTPEVAYDFSVLPNGQIEHLILQQASEEKRLNDEALEALKHSAPFKPYLLSDGENPQRYRIYFRRQNSTLYRMSFSKKDSVMALIGKGCCSDYTSVVLSLLEKQWSPPVFAQASPVYVSFQIDSVGNLQSLHLDASSGVSELDTYTLNTIKKLAPFPSYSAENKPAVNFALAIRDSGMVGKDSWAFPFSKTEKYREYQRVPASQMGNSWRAASGLEKTDQGAYIRLDAKNAKANSACNQAKKQLEAAMLKQLEASQRGAALMKQPDAYSFIKDEKMRQRMKEYSRKTVMVVPGPGSVTVRFTVASDAHPIAVYSLSNNDTREGNFLRQFAESLILDAGPYQLPPKHYEINLTYPASH